MARDQRQTVKEIGGQFGVDEPTLRGWSKDGALRATDITKGGRVAVRDLNGFLIRHQPRARCGGAYTGPDTGPDTRPNPGPARDGGSTSGGRETDVHPGSAPRSWRRRRRKVSWSA